MASAATAVPPLPQDVTSQQGPPLSQFAEGAAKNAPVGGAQGQQNSMEFVQQIFKQVGDLLTQAAQVISVEKPAMMPLIVRMAGVGAAIEKQLTSEAQGQGQKPKKGGKGPEPVTSQAPPPESQASLGI